MGGLPMDAEQKSPVMNRRIMNLVTVGTSIVAMRKGSVMRKVER
jgi:hypothetical protein